jgi:serine/threonine-protein kinase
MPLTAGTKLGPYEIVSPIGAGGMGEVYKARDTRLDRAVAIKILPAALAADPQFRERFDREARAISQLTHPNICTLYDVGDAVVSPQSSVASPPSSVTSHQSPATSADTVRFLVMELLDGETIEQRLNSAGSKGHGLQVDQALAIAIQIADALAAAHRAGIVHRDLKPGNIFLVRSGGASAPPVAKLLDFGLAKTNASGVSMGGATMLPTTPVNVTAQGTILGTFQYMAPEQIEGMEADARTDLFAFGCVLYEMLTGRKAFEGKTRASLLGAILKDEPPPVSRVQPIAPAALDRIVATCLAKDPDDRWQTARDLQRELKWVAAGSLAGGSTGPALHASEPGGSKGPALHPPRVMPIVATAIASAAIVGVAAWALMRPAPVSRPVIRLQAPPPATAPLFIDSFTSDVALSPDGARVAFIAGTGQPQLFVRALDQENGTPLAGIVGVRGPFFSPDGEWIGFFDLGSGDLKKVSIRGGPPVTICVGCGGGNRGASWGPDDTIVFAAGAGSQGLRRIGAAGGESVALTTPDVKNGEQGHTLPEFLPGGQAILMTVLAGGGSDNSMIAVRDLKTGAQKTLVRGGSHAHFAPTGHLVYAVSGTVRAVAFDLSQLSVSGNPIPVLDHVLMKPTGAADFSVASNGSLVYISGEAQANGQTLVWVDRQGHEEPIPAPPRNYVFPRLSPDAQRVALDIRDQQNDIWIWDFTRRVLTRLTTDPNADQFPVWTPDGRRIAFGSSRAGEFNLFWQPADGTGVAERLTTSPHRQYPWAFTSDGKSLVIRDTDPKTGPDVSVISMEGTHEPRPLIHSAFNEQNAELSPDGRWIAYQSNESGRDEIHVRPFPAVDSGHWQISTDGGARPLWARSGRELFFVDPRNRLMVASIQTNPGFAAGNPAVAVDYANGFIIATGRNYDVSADGRRFLLIKSALRDQTNASQLHVVLNWTEELKRLVPGKK